MSLVITKPQFNTDILKPGVPILIKYTSGFPSPSFRGKHHNALIVRSTPLEIYYVYCDERGFDDDQNTILIQDVTEETVRIQLLVPKEEDTK